MSGQDETIADAARANERKTHPLMMGDAVSRSHFGAGDIIRHPEIARSNDILIIDDGVPMPGSTIDLAAAMVVLIKDRLDEVITTERAMTMLVVTQQMLNGAMAQDHRETGVPFVQATIAETFAAITTLTEHGVPKVTNDTLRQVMLVSKDITFSVRGHDHGMQGFDGLKEKLVVPLNVPKIFQERKRHRVNEQPHAERFSQKLEQRNRNMTIAVNSKLSKQQQKKLRRKEDKDIAARLKAYHQKVRGNTAG